MLAEDSCCSALNKCIPEGANKKSKEETENEKVYFS
jgi:hypothetical protein